MATVQSVVRAQRRKKQQAVDYLGGKCIRCGYNKCLAALEFHHPDPKVKEQKLTYIVCRWSWERVLPELTKCVLVCSNCHREIHYGTVPVEGLRRHATPTWEKTCLACGTGFRTNRADRKYCSYSCSHMGQRKVHRPSRAQLARDIRSIGKWTVIGAKYGVTNTAVKKWARRYGLIPSRGYGVSVAYLSLKQEGVGSSPTAPTAR